MQNLNRKIDDFLSLTAKPSKNEDSPSEPKLAEEADLGKQATLTVFVGSTPALVGRKLRRLVNKLLKFGKIKYHDLFIDTAELTGKLTDLDYNRYHQLKAEESEMLLAWKYQDIFRKTHGIDPLEVFIKGNFPSTNVLGGGGIENNAHAAAMVDKGLVEKFANALNGLTQMGDNRGRVRNASEVNVHVVVFTGGATGAGAVFAILDKLREAAQNTGVNINLRLWAMLPLPRAKNKTKVNTAAFLYQLEAEHKASVEAEKALFSFRETGEKEGEDNTNATTEANHPRLSLAAAQRLGQVLLMGARNETGSFKDENELAQAVADNIILQITDAAGVGGEMRRLEPDMRNLLENDPISGLPTHLSAAITIALELPLDLIIEYFTKLNLIKVIKGLLEGPQPGENELEEQKGFLTDEGLNRLKNAFQNRQQPPVELDLLGLIMSGLGVTLAGNGILGAMAQGLTFGMKKTLNLTTDEIGPDPRDWTPSNLAAKEAEFDKVFNNEVIRAVYQKASTFVETLQLGLDQMVVSLFKNESLNYVQGQINTVLTQVTNALATPVNLKARNLASEEEALKELREGACQVNLFRQPDRDAREEYVQFVNEINSALVNDLGRQLGREVLTKLKLILTEIKGNLEKHRASLLVASKEATEKAGQLLAQLTDTENVPPTHFPILSDLEALVKLFRFLAPYASLSPAQAARAFIDPLFTVSGDGAISADAQMLLQAKANPLLALLEDNLNKAMLVKITELDYNAARALIENYTAMARRELLFKAQQHARDLVYYSRLIANDAYTTLVIGLPTEDQTLRQQLEKDFTQALNGINATFTTSLDPATIQISLVTYGISAGSINDFAWGRFRQAYLEYTRQSDLPVFRSEAAKARVEKYRIEERVSLNETYHAPDPAPSPNGHNRHGSTQPTGVAPGPDPSSRSTN
jgi:hypothetical protein